MSSSNYKQTPEYNFRPKTQLYLSKTPQSERIQEGDLNGDTLGSAKRSFIPTYRGVSNLQFTTGNYSTSNLLNRELKLNSGTRNQGLNNASERANKINGGSKIY